MDRGATAVKRAPRRVTRGSDLLERVAALPAGVWLGALVVASIGARYAIAANHPAPFIFTDELLYGELAKSFAATGHFALREVPGTAGFGVVYPLLLAPAYRIFADVPTAYALMKLINVVVMSLTAIPVYLLARRLVDRWLALVAAALTLALPALLYTGNIMTENAFFPAFMLWCWVAVTMLERPTVLRQLGTLAALGLCYFTRPQAAVLVPALLVVIAVVLLLDVLGERGVTRSRAAVRGLRVYAPTWGALIAAALLYLLLQTVVRGKPLSTAAFGSYSVLTNLHYTVGGVGRWFVYHVGELDFSLAILPFAALLVVALVGLRPRQARELRVFAAFAVVVSLFLLVEVAAFASTPYGLRIQERNMFYLDPLFLIALVVCVGRAIPWRHPVATALGAVVAAALPGAVPFASFLGPHATTDAFAVTTFISVLERHWVGLGQLQIFAVFAGLLGAAIFVVTPRRYALALPALTLIALALMNGPVNRRTTDAAQQSRLGGVQARRNWIDRAVGTKPDVAALWSGRAAYVTLWDNEFFNRSVGKVYNFAGPPDGLPQQTVAVDAATGRIELDGKPLRAKYVLADPTEVLRGRPLVRDKGLGMTVYRVDGPVVAAGALDGVYPDLWTGGTASYTVYACTGGSVLVRLTGDPKSHPFPQTITAATAGRTFTKTVKPKQFYVPFSVPVRPEKGVCRVDYTIAPTAVPDQRLHNGDTRELGIRFSLVVYRPPHGPPVANR